MPRWTVRFDLRLNLADERLLKAVYRAEALATVIRGIPLPPETRRGLDRLNIIRAVRGTTGIEGSDLSADEVDRIDAATTSALVLGPAREREEKEARNALNVMHVVARRIDAEPLLPLTEPLIRELHALTTTGISYPSNEPGRYRSGEVTAGEYRAPDAAEVPALMEAFVSWANSPAAVQLPALARAVSAHFYFISVHPFGDGNGRTARAVESLLLYQRGINLLGFYSLSNFYYRRRAEYIEMLDFTRFASSHDLTPFVTFAAEGLLQELELIRDEVLDANQKVAFRDYSTQTLMFADTVRSPVRSRLIAIMAVLQQGHVITEAEITSGRSPLAALYRGMHPRASSRDLATLARLGLVTRTGSGVKANFDVMAQFTPRAS